MTLSVTVPLMGPPDFGTGLSLHHKFDKPFIPQPLETTVLLYVSRNENTLANLC